MQFTSDSANLYRIETTRKAVILTMLTGEELKGNVFIHLSSYRPFELEDVSAAIRGEREPRLGRTDAVGQARALEALLRSAAEGRPVAVA